ncbi:hypothetical protein CCP4SC76_1700007 [Gammaproteobacteria bacterium]
MVDMHRSPRHALTAPSKSIVAKLPSGDMARNWMGSECSSGSVSRAGSPRLNSWSGTRWMTLSSKGTTNRFSSDDTPRAVILSGWLFWKECPSFETEMREERNFSIKDLSMGQVRKVVMMFAP